MPNIDTATIEGFDGMSADEKVQALLSVEIPEAIDLSKYVSKETFDKKASEAARLARDLKNIPDLSAIKQERDTAKTDLTAAQAKIEQYEREKLLLGKGVSADDVDYYAFKIGKLVTDSKSFEQAATEYFADKQPRGTVRVDLGGSLSGGGAPNTPNDMMNALIRRAGK